MQQTLSKERPILFSGAMVRAILEGRKTQTRRVIKGSHKLVERAQPGTCNYDFWFSSPTHERVGDLKQNACPYGNPGDRLWVRETWAKGWFGDKSEGEIYAYRADEELCGVKWKPSMHMPRVASRITLEVTEVRVERLQGISQDDAIAEGIEKIGDLWKDYDGWVDVGCDHWEHPVNSFRSLWDSINAARGYGWDANPWVWVVTFEAVK